MIEVLRFAGEGPLNFIITFILLILVALLLTTILDKFKPININYFSQQPMVNKGEDNND